ncbi:HET-domain-containing protein [Aspergillus ibericus CBS 121593]|uniref:HET-domain-containing protein n=1 Tax=Aspergillus ibericus CBS 121593 TaxID=1448316 RepID=A0A395GKB4_9EURO|nr:HET-domain-containing protein [Aspergillus ibericus CBS 121593]RAK95909.1 HET-domain-containing protein [Aspergillus ibericus CBS 121593]
MVLVQELHERYLWVDRLCLIQDNLSKHDGIRNMGSIYSHALLTIIALSGEDANHGLPGVFPGSRPPQMIQRVKGVHLMPALPDLQYALEASLHTTRGWTFPEVLLSSRRLFVSDRQVYFNCQKGIVRGEDSCQEHDPSFEAVYGLASQSGLYGGLVKSYTRRSLTYDTDIVDAFSGISSLLSREDQMNRRGELAAGLPLLNFLPHLLWVPENSLVRRPPRTSDQLEDHFPSWSWIGWRGPVSYELLRLTSTIPRRPLKSFLAPCPMKYIQPNGTQAIVYQPDQGAERNRCSCTTWKRINHDPHAGMPTSLDELADPIVTHLRGRHILRFRTLTLPAASFSCMEEEDDGDGEDASDCPRLLYHGQVCGSIIGQPSADVASNLPRYKWILLCYVQGLVFIIFDLMRMRGIDHDSENPESCRCVLFFLLVEPREGLWERVALAIMNPGVFEGTNFQWEDIQLA